jgi:type II secretory pathway component GspD/PulD (secretin)
MPFAAALLLLGGCATTDEDAAKQNETPDIPPAVRTADHLFQQKRFTEAIIACIELSRKDPLTPGLAELQARILTRMEQLRRENILARDTVSRDAMASDARRQGLVPDTYRLNRHVLGATSPQRTPLNKMQEMLRRPVSVHLDKASLADIVTQIGASQNINFIADSGVGADKTVTIHAETTPLVEILEYVGRNMGVNFSVGQSIIWATESKEQQNTVPMETRVYRLRKGLPGNEVPGGAALGEKAQAGKGEIAIVDAIKRFVAQPKGSDLSFDTRAHALLIKNTRENLGATEDIIAALDVRPQQVLIEARFISTTATDTRALGIDWLLAGTAKGAGGSANATTVPANIPTGIDTPVGPIKLSGDNLGIGQLSAGAGSFLYQGVLDDIRLRAVLSAIDKNDQTRTLTAPRITTVNNRTATIHIGEDFQYYDNLTYAPAAQYYNNGYGNSFPTNSNYNNTPSYTGTPKTIKLGYKLAVTPSIGADLATINLALIPDITELVNESSWTSFNDPMNPAADITKLAGKLPIVKQKKMETEVVVRSGETVVMGGLAQASGGKTRNGIPWLEDIPLLGYLFRTDSMNEGTDNLLIFVTATILSDIGEELIPLNPPDLPGQPVAAGLR